MVGASNNTCAGRAQPSLRLIWLIRATATSESPPAAKKSSWTDSGPVVLSACCHRNAIASSVAVRGAITGPSVTDAASKARRAAASTLPLAPTGNVSSTCTRLGTM